MRSAIASRHQLRLLSRRYLGSGSGPSSGIAGEASGPVHDVRPRWTTASARSYAVPALKEREDEEVYERVSHGSPPREVATAAAAGRSGSADQSSGAAPNTSQPGPQRMDFPSSSSSSTPAPPPSKAPRPLKLGKARKLSPKLERVQSRLVLAQILREQAVNAAAPPVPLSQLEGGELDVFHLRGSRGSGVERDELGDEAQDGTAPSAGKSSVDSAGATEGEPTLDALMRLKPSDKRKPGIFSKAYTKRYEAVSQRLGVAFVRNQLFGLCNALLEANARERAAAAEAGAVEAKDAETPRDTDAASLIKPRLRVSHKASKAKLLQCIMDAWGWPAPEAVEREKKRRELESVVSEESVGLSNAEAFVISRDERLWAELAGMRGLQISVQRAPSVAIKATGTAAALDAWRAAVQNGRSDCSTNEVSLEHLGGVRPELLQVISEASGAFLERVSDSVLRMTYSYPTAKDEAMRLLAEAHRNLDEVPARTPLAAITINTSASIIAAPTQLALYPFMPVSQRVDATRLDALTWWLAGRSCFRLRRAGGWTKRLSWETAASLDEGQLRVLRQSSSSASTKLSDLLAGMATPPSDSGASIRWEVAHGAVVFSSAPDPSSEAGIHMQSSLEGHISITSLEQSLEKGDLTSTFLASPAKLPAEVGSSTTPTTRREVTYAAANSDGHQRLYVFEAEQNTGGEQGSKDTRVTPSVRAFHVERQRLLVLLPDGRSDVQITRDVRQPCAGSDIPAAVLSGLASGPEDKTWTPAAVPSEITLAAGTESAILISDRWVTQSHIANQQTLKHCYRRIRAGSGTFDAESELQHTIHLEGDGSLDELAGLCIPETA